MWLLSIFLPFPVFVHVSIVQNLYYDARHNKLIKFREIPHDSYKRELQILSHRSQLLVFRVIHLAYARSSRNLSDFTLFDISAVVRPGVLDGILRKIGRVRSSVRRHAKTRSRISGCKWAYAVTMRNPKYEIGTTELPESGL